MPTRVYSVRFMVGRGGNRTERFTVPEGKRAVVRSWHFAVWGATPANVYLRSHGILVVMAKLSGTGTSLRSDVRFSLYEREQLDVVVEGPDASYAVDGFLYEDPDGTPDDANNVITTPLRVEALPA